MFFNLIKDIFLVFPFKTRIYFFSMLALFLLSMFLETLTIALFLPIVTLILNKDISENLFYKKFNEIFDLNLVDFISDYKTFFIYFFLIFLFKTIILVFCKYQILNFSKNFNVYLVSTLFRKYISIPFNKFVSRNSSEFMRNLTHEIEQFSSALFQILELISELIIIFGILSFLLFFNLKISIISAISFFLIVFVFYFFSKKALYDINNKIRFYEQLRLKNYIESFNLIKEIKLFNSEKYFINKNYNFTEKFWQHDVYQKFIRLIPRPTIELFLLIAIIFLVFFLVENKGSTYTLEFLAIFLAATYRVVPSLFKIINNVQNIRSCSPSVSNLIADLKSVELNEDINKKQFSGLKTKIEIKNLSFEYETSKARIFQNISFNIEFAKTTGIKGKTGSGKTTLINLICGLLNPSSGSIKFDNNSTEEINIKSLHKKIGYVPQNIYLLDESILKNILFGDEKIDDEKINKILKICELENFVKELPLGLETVIGEKSSKISGGQTQRIGIARALYKNPSILILDEATNALDIKTSQKIMSNLKKLNETLTIVVISHDEKIQNICDTTIDINSFKN